jgi:molybdate transport system substrate-binding protein
VKKQGVFLLLALAVLLSCGKEKGLRIAVAANFSAAAEELKKEYRKLHPETVLEIIIGSSGKLAMQIMHGAPYDIFFSADMKRPEILRERGFASGSPLSYACGRLILLRAEKGMTRMTLASAVKDTSKRVIIANPELAPYGKAALEVLKGTGLYTGVKPRLVIAENVVQSARYALLGKGTCFTAMSLLQAPALSERAGEISWIEVDTRLYRKIEQGVVIISESKNIDAARSFLDFVLTSNEAKRIIRRFGYTTPESSGNRRRSKG